jgi:hypothetical protein
MRRLSDDTGFKPEPGNTAQLEGFFYLSAS